ncbi:MAG: hypothetical protein JRJ43_07775 [Deltaproteobacteria bacterium]|nr:hypothetical protein [Deltaproteobacteria bacterium]MBW1719450.1 hypothetical protein [Deltaproteobacteria bacterium]MBW1937985.1 hypothetical protein [Deltaproteobacteria bacterium]MBW1964791.1 hypothetical protein [Deltaproteobacteria bacterium]MBW2079577.1 hypothetical protein [Deltaproteobacteria bacterium]
MRRKPKICVDEFATIKQDILRIQKNQSDSKIKLIETNKDENFVGILQGCLGPEGCQVTKPFICENFPVGIRIAKKAAILLLESCPQLYLLLDDTVFFNNVIERIQYRDKTILNLTQYAEAIKWIKQIREKMKDLSSIEDGSVEKIFMSFLFIAKQHFNQTGEIPGDFQTFTESNLNEIVNIANSFIKN